MGCVSMFAQESLPPAINEQATARQLGLSEVEMARTLRAAVCSGVVLHALIKLVWGEFIVFARGDGDGEYRPGHHAGGGADLRMNVRQVGSEQAGFQARALPVM